MCGGAGLVLSIRAVGRGVSRGRGGLVIISKEGAESEAAGRLIVLQLVEVRHSLGRQRGQIHGPLDVVQMLIRLFGTSLHGASGMATKTWLPAGPGAVPEPIAIMCTALQLFAHARRVSVGRIAASHVKL